MALVRPSSAAATLLLLATLPSALAFSFSYSAPAQCGALTINWSGGTAPFSILVTPAYDVPRNISVPAGAFTNGQGSYTISPFPIVSQKQFLLTMSDATGFGSGGTSDLLTVADPVSGATCDTSVPTLAFDFQLNTALQQCRPYVISDFNLATQPVTIYGLIPLGSVFSLNPAAGAISYSWATNVKSGTRLILTVTDGQGRSGGSSDLLTVGASDDATCIDANSPASTITNQPTSAAASSASKTRSATRTASKSSGASATSQPDNAGKSSTGGVIAGAIIGVVVLLLLVGTLIWFLLRRRRNKTDSPRLSTQFRKRRSLMPIDPAPNEPGTTLETGGHYEAEPYMLPASAAPTSTHGTSESGHYPPGRPESGSAEGNRYAPAPSSSHTSKYSEAFSGRGPPNTPARFVLHTDAGEIPQEADEDEVVELPPQYNTLNGANVGRSPTYRRPGQEPPAGGNPSPNGDGQQQQQQRGGYSTGPFS